MRIKPEFNSCSMIPGIKFAPEPLSAQANIVRDTLQNAMSGFAVQEQLPAFVRQSF